MAIFVVTYTYTAQPDVLARLRPQRYAFFQELDAGGSLLASGQLLGTDLGDGMLVITARTSAEAAAILDGDPFVTAGVVTRRTITEWNPTIGAWLAH